MVSVVALAAVGALLIGVAVLRRVSPVALALTALVSGYVLGHSFWNARLGPLPLTLDRMVLGATALVFLGRWWRGSLANARWGRTEWALLACLAVLSVSAACSVPDETVSLPTSPLWRLLVAFWVPAALVYLLRRSAEVTSSTGAALWTLAALGLYLTATALAETAGAWSLVFPRYIADPEQGLHFGRARGPALNSVSLGFYLSVGFWACWLICHRTRGLTRWALAGTLPVVALAVLLTYTRSTWIGLGLSVLPVLALQLPRVWRWPVLGTLVLAGGLIAPLAYDQVVRLKREDSGEVSAHSVGQREAFAYISWKIFCDHPLAGVGFGRFYDQKLPYLSDRSQPFELESLRGLHHHNTFLGLLTETGPAGLVAYLAVLAGLMGVAWRLASSEAATPDQRRLGVLAVATVTAYLPSALFHDVTHIHQDQWLLFLVAGLALGCERGLTTPGLKPTGAEATHTPWPRLAGLGWWPEPNSHHGATR